MQLEVSLQGYKGKVECIRLLLCSVTLTAAAAAAGQLRCQHQGFI